MCFIRLCKFSVHICAQWIAHLVDFSPVRPRCRIGRILRQRGEAVTGHEKFTLRACEIGRGNPVCPDAKLVGFSDREEDEASPEAGHQLLLRRAWCPVPGALCPVSGDW